MARPMGTEDRPAAKRSLGLVMLTALVVGNMVGSGVFLLPSALAPFGGVSILGWCVTAGGTMAFGLVLARLARRSPDAGGPYAFTRDAFGELPAFLVGWGYWISCWCAQAAIAIAMVGYLRELVPAIESQVAASAIAIGAILVLAAVNVAGVKDAGLVQVVTTILKLLPLIAIALFGFTRFDASNLEPFNPTGERLDKAVLACLALTLWAFLGFESATVAAGEARDARRNVPRATLIGIAIATVLYVASTLAVMGLEPRESLAVSTAPFADAARELWGSGAGKLIAAGAFISCFGALNGWTLVSGQMPLAIARDGLFPAFFGRLSGRDTPAQGLVFSSLLAGALVVASYSESLVRMYSSMIVLSTMASLVALVFSAMADMHLTLRERRPASGPATGALLIAGIAFVYGFLAIAGATHREVAWGFLLLLAGIPFYVVARAGRTAAAPASDAAPAPRER